MKTRPLGITILSWLFGLNTVFYVAFVAMALFAPGTLVAIRHTLSPSGAGPEAIHAAMGRAQPFYYSLMAVLTGAMTVAFWRLRNWARIVMLALIALSLLLMTTEVRPLLAAPTAAAIGLTLARIGLSLFWVWYLFRPAVQAAFQRPPITRTALGTTD
jgi:hypothetical protein